MGLPWRGNKDDSWHQHNVSEPTNHAGVGNFLEFASLHFESGIKLWDIIWRLLAARRPVYLYKRKTCKCQQLLLLRMF